MGPAPQAPLQLARVELYWLPLGAGDTSRCVRWNGRIFEKIVAHRQHRQPRDLYHSALQVYLGSDRYVIEMAPEWGNKRRDRGVVSRGAVGLPLLGHFRFFRYEVRRWRDGIIHDAATAVASPQCISTGTARAEQLLDLVAAFPAATWGRDEFCAGEMWNSNSLIAWLLARSGHRTGGIRLPANGRAPGWSAGMVVATRQVSTPRSLTTAVGP
jgi:hypothetical protein